MVGVFMGCDLAVGYFESSAVYNQSRWPQVTSAMNLTSNRSFSVYMKKANA